MTSTLMRIDRGGNGAEREARGSVMRARARESGERDARADASTSPRLSAGRGEDEDGETREALLDGLEAFALASAVVVKARAAVVERTVYRTAAQTGRAETLPPRTLMSSWVDVPLYAAVVAGTVLRRMRRAREENSVSALADKAPSSLRARLAALEQANDGVLEISRRTARDVSRLGTRVRLTRRELSPPLRKVQAESNEHAQILAAVAEKIESLESELAEGQSTMSGLHTVSSKQFDVLSRAIADLKASQMELATALSEVRAEAAAAAARPLELEASEYDVLPARESRDEERDDERARREIRALPAPEDAR